MRLVLEVAAHAGAQRVEVLEIAEILRELVVELRDDALADRLDRDVVVDRRAGELRDRVVVGIVDVERLFVAFVQADQLLVEPRRVGRGADLDRDVVVLVGLRFCRRSGGVGSPAMTTSGSSGSCFGNAVRSRSITTESPSCDAAAFDRFVARRAFAQAGQRFVDRRVLDVRGLLVSVMVA